MLSQTVKKIFETQNKLLKKIEHYSYRRFLYDALVKDADQKIITGVSGLRGTGKTVLLLQLLRELDGAVYISADMLEQSVDFFQVIDFLVRNYKIRFLLLDEIHYIKEWARLLKNIYDLYDIKVFFTSSVSLNILHTRVDLARRVKILDLPVMSFREYLLLKYGKTYGLQTLDELISKEQAINTFLEGEFLEYLKTPLPALLEVDPYPVVENIIEAVIFRDLSNYKNLSQSELHIISKLLDFLSVVPGGDISITSLANEFGITKYKAGQYIKALEEAFLIHTVTPAGRNVLKEPKILLNIPFRVYLAERINKIFDIMGPLKEDFFISMLKGAKIKPYYLKTKKGRKTPDFLIEINGTPCVFEIGGKKKGFSQFKGVSVDCKYIVTYPYEAKKNAIPLWKFGFLY